MHSGMVSLAEAAVSTAVEIAERIYRSDPYKDVPAAVALTNGRPGMAVLFTAVHDATGDSEWANRAREQLRMCARVPSSTPWSLYNGLAGLLFSVRYVGKGIAYSEFRRSLIEAIAQRVSLRFAGGFTTPEFTAEYELILGAAGVALALACENAAEETSTLPGVSVLRDYLMWLLDDDGTSRWYAPVHSGAGAEPTNNIGIAHGICAPMIALTRVCSPTDSRARTLITRAADLIVRRAERGQHGTRWPAGFAGDRSMACRQGWCYGTPSVALLLAQIGSWLGEPHLLQMAADAMLELEQAGEDSWGRDDHAICHGTAGLALTSQYIASMTGSERLAQFSQRLYEELIAGFRTGEKYGYRSFIMHTWTDSPSLLEGAGGIALALVSLSDAVDRSWRCMFAMPEQD